MIPFFSIEFEVVGEKLNRGGGYHWMKSVKTRSFFWSVFSRIRSMSLYSVRMRENTGQKKLRIWTHAVYGLKLQVKYRFYGQKIDCPLTD